MGHIIGGGERGDWGSTEKLLPPDPCAPGQVALSSV